MVGSDLDQRDTAAQWQAAFLDKPYRPPLGYRHSITKILFYYLRSYIIQGVSHSISLTFFLIVIVITLDYATYNRTILGRTTAIEINDI